MNILKNKNIQLIGFILIVLLLLVAISGKRVKPVPGDKRHALASDNVSCLACHAPGKISPLIPTHPPKEQCLTCHKLPKDRRPLPGK
jgi:hypothetical protein